MHGRNKNIEAASVFFMETIRIQALSESKALYLRTRDVPYVTELSWIRKTGIASVETIIIGSQRPGLDEILKSSYRTYPPSGYGVLFEPRIETRGRAMLGKKLLW